MNSWLHDSLMLSGWSDSTFEYLIDWALKGSALLGAAGVMVMLWRRHGAALRHQVWASALAALLIVPVVALMMPSFDVALPASLPSSLPPIVPAQVKALNEGNKVIFNPELESSDFSAKYEKSLAVPASWRNWEPVEKIEQDRSVTVRPPVLLFTAPTDKEIIESAKPFPWSLVALLVWLMGTAVVAGRLVFGLHQVRRMIRTSVPYPDAPVQALVDEIREENEISRPVRLLISKLAPVPMTCGFLNPVIMVPRGARFWPAERWRVVLRHELAHIRRSDWPAQIAGQIACALHWFNPLAWFAMRRMRLERELACDDAVLESGLRPSEYATHLIQIARSSRRASSPFVAALAMSRRTDLEARVNAILDSHRSTIFGGRGKSRSMKAWLAAGLAVSALSLFQVTVIAQDTKLPVRENRYAITPVTDSDEDRARGNVWFTLGMNAFNTGDCDTAILAFLNSAELGNAQAASIFNVAASHAKKGDADKTFEWLNNAVDVGFMDKDTLARSEEFEKFRKDDRYMEVLRRMTFEKREKIDAAAWLSKKMRGEGKNGQLAFTEASKGSWAEVAKTFEPLAKEHTENGELAFYVGYAKLLAGDWQNSLPYFERSLLLGYDEGKSAYNIACGNALTGNKDKSFEWLEKAMEFNDVDVRQMESDSDLQSLKDDARFNELLEKAKKHQEVMWSNEEFKSMAELEKMKGLEGLKSLQGLEELKGLDESIKMQMNSMDMHNLEGLHSGELQAEIHERVAEAMKQVAELQAEGWSGTWFNDNDGDFGKAFDLHQEGKYDESIELFKKCINEDLMAETAAYNVACGYALKGNKDEALTWLEKSAGMGFDGLDTIEDDSDMDSLRDDPRFTAAIEKMKAAHHEEMEEEARELEMQAKELMERAAELKAKQAEKSE